MTAYDEHVLDATHPDKQLVVFSLLESMDGYEPHEHDRAPAVFDFTFAGQHCVITPFCIPGDFTIDVAMFDAEGTKINHRVMSIMSADLPFVRGGE
jgi:hypothetical protein